MKTQKRPLFIMALLGLSLLVGCKGEGPRGSGGDGGALVTLASGQSDPEGIAVDDNAVYWTNGGMVMKVAK